MAGRRLLGTASGLGRRVACIVLVSAVAASAGGCSMTTEWWVMKSLQRAGLSKPEAQCATTGVLNSLTADQIEQVRSAILFGDRPDRFAGPAALIDWLAERVDDRTEQVLRHYADHCRTA